MAHHKKYHKQNELLSDQALYTGEIDNPTEISVISYNNQVCDIRALHNGDIPLTQDKFITWIKINGMNNYEWIAQIARSLEIPQMSIQKMLRSQSSTGIESYEGFIQCNFRYYRLNKAGELESEQICYVLGKGFVITMQETDTPIFEDIICALEKNTIELRTRSANYLFLLLMNHILLIYNEQAFHLKDDFEIMEDELLESYNTEDDFLNRLKQKRKLYQTLKQVVLPLKDNFQKIQSDEYKIFERKDKIYINTVFAHFNEIIQTLDSSRELFDVLLNLYLSNNDLRMNEIMKRLTVISAIFIPLTFLVGIWGMNFENMPELKAQHGYLIAWILMIAIGLGAWWYMKKRKWY